MKKAVTSQALKVTNKYQNKDLYERTKRMKRVITYGTFDLLHYGHIELLKRAKALGDYLIVVLSTDEFNWNEKQKKCYFSYEIRKQLLEAIRYVDLVSKNAAKQNYTTTVLIPQFVPNRRWQNILHNQTSLRLRLRLSWRENIVISTYSYHLKK